MAEDGAGGELRVLVTGDRDPGYGSTSKIIAETAICLLKHRHRPPAACGRQAQPSVNG